MRITQLDLKAFKSYVGVSVPTDAPRVLVGGLNGSGKSSLREALKWCLLGRCAGTDGKGAGVDRLAPQGIAPSHVDVSIWQGKDREIRRTWQGVSTAFGVSGFTGTAQAQQEGLYQQWQTDERFLSAVLDSGAFLDLHHAEAKALVLSLLNVTIQIGDHAYALYEIDALYQDAYEARKTLKRDLGKFGTPTKPADQDMPNPEDVETLLGQRRAELETKVAALGEANGSAKGSRGLVDRYTADLGRLDETIALRRSEHLSEQIETLEERLAQMEADAVPTPAPQPVEPGVGTEGRAIFLRSKIEELKAHNPADGCVLAPGIPCETAKLRFNKAAKVFKAELDGLPLEVPVAPAAVSANPITATRQELERLQRRQGELVAAEQEQASVQKALDKAKADALPALETSTLQTEVDDLKARIRKGEGILAAARAYWRDLHAYDEAMATKVRMETKLVELEQTVETLGPHGVRVQALGSAMGGFEAAVNAFTGPFGFEVRFSVEPWDVVVNGRSVATYSRSEAYRIGIAIQLAIAHLSGLSFAVIDELDLLDAANRRLLTQMIVQAPIEQILVLSTREPEQGLPAVPGVLAYRIEKQAGRSVITERSAA